MYRNMNTEDHPCVCREKLQTRYCFVIFQGSPLRVQGKVYIIFRKIILVRITPACAGKRTGQAQAARIC